MKKLLVIIIVLAISISWGMNVVAIVHSIDNPLTGLFILRCIGIFIAPLGVILGLV